MRTKDYFKENYVRYVIVFVMLLLLGLSFFFASSIESFFGLANALGKNQISGEGFNSSYKVTYIDVGQGNSTLIEFPDGKTALIDAGNEIYGEKIGDVLAEKGIGQIDYLIATHADSDHIGGFNYVLDLFEVKNVFRPFQIAGTGASADSFEVYDDEDLKGVYESICSMSKTPKISRITSSIYKEFITKIYDETYIFDGSAYQCKVTVFYNGLKIDGNGYSIEFFFPKRNADYGSLENNSNTYGYATVGYGASDSNGCSAIFLVKIGEEKFFFSGDAPCSSGSKTKKHYEELDFLNSLSESQKQDLTGVSIYIAGHHGSAYSSSDQLISLILPRFTVISVGEFNTYGHPAESMLLRVAKNPRNESDYLLRTDKFGTITFGTVDGELKYKLEKFDINTKFNMSWYVLGSIIFVSLSFVVFNIRGKKSQKQIFIDWQNLFILLFLNNKGVEMEKENQVLVNQKYMMKMVLKGLEKPLFSVTKTCGKLAKKLRQIDENIRNAKQVEDIYAFSKDFKKVEAELISSLALRDRLLVIKNRNEKRLALADGIFNSEGVYTQEPNKGEIEKTLKEVQDVNENSINLNCGLSGDERNVLFDGNVWVMEGSKLNLSDARNHEAFLAIDENQLENLMELDSKCLSTLDDIMLLNVGLKKKILHEIAIFVIENLEKCSMSEINEKLGDLLSLKKEVPRDADSYVAGVQNLYAIIEKHMLLKIYPRLSDKISKLECNENSELIPVSVKKRLDSIAAEKIENNGN